MLKKCFYFVFLLLNLNAEANATDTNLSFDSSKIETEAPKIELSLSSLYQNADEVVKGVIYILVLFSILAWAVFISKLMQFYFMKKNLDLSIQKIKELKNLNELDQTKDFAGVLSLEIQDELEKSEYKNDHIKERIELRLQNTISKQITASKNGLSLLASIGASAPFIGLFGTVWGIMNAFIGIANLGNASLAVVAPGIAEALFATAFGLIAAIPAVLFYNYLTRKNLKLMHHLDELANFVYILFHRSYFNDKTEMAHKEEELSEINITPFIDIMLVLLIVFMAVTPLITSSIKIELPKSSQQAEDKLKNPIILYLNTDNTLAINDDKLSLENLSSALDIKTKGNKEEIIYFHIDKSVKYEDIMQVMQKLKENGYGKIALSSKKMD
ncbi:hypothetical protein F0O96_06480 [Campylobacter jejuni]|uniref:MotA/TolQ/ExbB proton channel domain-containing protein n=5 Tax=Campylobacter TaxID=194 RepID=A0A6C7SXR4_CAMJU|nr:hypothetical protein [Campylobacter jejuni]EAL1818572.1 hypothetical protein [Campylobacter jejuni]ECR1861108.1 hypothetical protein [Campylobacter jejuni]